MRTKDTKAKAVVDDDEARHLRWTLCCLSRQTLQPPIMIDRLGQLYNKEALLEYMIRRASKSASESENEVARHIKSLKADVRQVTLHANPVKEAELGDIHYFPYACPLTQRVMNGKHKFVCLWPCGCVVSESGLRETCLAGQSKRELIQPHECPQCAQAFRPDALVGQEPRWEADVVWLYPSPATRDALLAQRMARPKRKATRQGPCTLPHTQ